MITEAGMIGKIGLNSAGVGVTYNALYTKGTDTSGLPSHLAMRMALESHSVDDACSNIKRQGGMAASAYILVGDGNTARGVEFTAKDIILERPNDKSYIVHTNHFTMEHATNKSDEGVPPADSLTRLERVHELLRGAPMNRETFSNIWKDEKGLPTSICRMYKEGQSLGATLFSIVIEHTRRRAVVKLGRPVEPEEIIELAF